MDNVATYLFLLLLLGLATALLCCGLYHLVKKAVKQALQEYEQEKEARNGSQ